MSAATIHGVQFFLEVDGRLAHDRFFEFAGVAEACRAAEERVRNGRATGAAVFARRIIQTPGDDRPEPVTLATFGLVPAGVVDQLPF